MENGLLGFGNLNYGLLSPTQIAAMSAPQQYPTGTYGQKMKAGINPAAPQSGDYYDPYYNLRNYEGLLGNPNFAWLNSFNTDPLNIQLPAQVVPGASTANSTGGMGGLVEGWKEKADDIKDLFDLSNNKNKAPVTFAGTLNQFDLSDPNTWVGETRGKLNEAEDNARQWLALNNASGGVGQVGGKLNEIEDNLRQGLSLNNIKSDLDINKLGNINTYTNLVGLGGGSRTMTRDSLSGAPSYTGGLIERWL